MTLNCPENYSARCRTPELPQQLDQFFRLFLMDEVSAIRHDAASDVCRDCRQKLAGAVAEALLAAQSEHRDADLVAGESLGLR